MGVAVSSLILDGASVLLSRRLSSVWDSLRLELPEKQILFYRCRHGWCPDQSWPMGPCHGEAPGAMPHQSISVLLLVSHHTLTAVESCECHLGFPVCLPAGASSVGSADLLRPPGHPPPTCSQPPQEFIPRRYSLGRSRPGKALRKVLLFCKSSQKGFSEEVIFEFDFEEWVGVSGEKATTTGEIGEEKKLKRALSVLE